MLKQPEADRTRFLYWEDLYRLSNAHDFAESIGLKWGFWVTILRRHLPGSTPADLPWLQRRTLRLLQAYAKRKGLRFEHLWVRENSARNGDHFHLLTTIPDDLCEAIQGLLKRRLGLTDRGMQVDPTYNPFTLMRYLSKQLDPRLLHFEGYDAYSLKEFIGLHDKPGDLPLEHRRSGVSRGIGPACQAKAGFKPLRSVDDLRDFYSGHRDNEKIARRRGWNDGPPDIAAPYDAALK